MVWEAQWDHWLGLGHHRRDPRGDSKGGISDSYDKKGYWRWSLWGKMKEELKTKADDTQRMWGQKRGSRIDTDTTRVAYWPGLISKERRPHVLKMRINHEDTFVSLYLH